VVADQPSGPAERVVAFYNQRGTAEQWIKEGKGAVKCTRLSCRSVSDGRYTTFQMAEVTVPRQMLQEILMLIAQLRAPPAPT
jgi:hypothetical protein